MNILKSISCFILLLCFTGCKIDHIQDDVSAILKSINEQPMSAEDNSGQLETNTDILLDIKKTVDKLASEENLQSTESEIKTEAPKKAETNWGSSASHYYIQKYTASWCAPCKIWEQNERHKLLDGVQLKEFDVDIHKNKVDVVPYFFLKVWDGSQWVEFQSYSGYTKAETLNNRILLEVNKKNVITNQTTSDRKILKKKRLRTANEIRSWISNNINLINSVQDADVYPRSNVWNHLTDPQHGFTRNQINGLDMRMAFLLHKASHGNIIGPYIWQ